MIFAFTPFAIALWARRGAREMGLPDRRDCGDRHSAVGGCKTLARNSPCCNALTKPGGLTANAKATEGYALQ